MTFQLAPDALASPDGFAEACRQARIYVEANVPGEHRPMPDSFFRYDDSDNIIGCGCAVGYLLTALTGSLSAARQYGSDRRLHDFGLPDVTALYDFESGFDRGIQSGAVGLQGWSGAGARLGGEWRPIR